MKVSISVQKKGTTVICRNLTVKYFFVFNSNVCLHCAGLLDDELNC